MKKIRVNRTRVEDALIGTGVGAIVGVTTPIGLGVGALAYGSAGLLGSFAGAKIGKYLKRSRR